MWFTDIAEIQNPGREELVRFVDAVLKFLGFVLERDEFAFLWQDVRDLRDLARETFNGDVVESAGELNNAIANISERVLASHGLVGRPARFKFRVLNSIANLWPARAQLRIRGWFKQMVEAIDAILGSLVDAAGGAGGIIKEFKDALAPLAGTTE